MNNLFSEDFTEPINTYFSVRLQLVCFLLDPVERLKAQVFCCGRWIKIDLFLKLGSVHELQINSEKASTSHIFD
jgi:hypothetical protein